MKALAVRVLCVWLCRCSASSCESWCAHPCEELNGNVHSECGSCSATFSCNPAANGFPRVEVTRVAVTASSGEADPIGHLRPIGQQQPTEAVQAADSPLEPHAFASQVAAAEPLHLRGFVRGLLDPEDWQDASLARRCSLPDGRNWRVTVAGSPSQSYQWIHNLSFCGFLERYADDLEGGGGGALYLVQALDERVDLLETMRLPPEFRCDFVERALVRPKLWMSAGDTWSSLHYDPHDAVLAQLDGTKVLHLLPPSEATVANSLGGAWQCSELVQKLSGNTPRTYRMMAVVTIMRVSLRTQAVRGVHL